MPTSHPSPITSLEAEIAGCRVCVEAPRNTPLPHEPRPVCVISPTARIAICGQAPGTRVHASGRPFTDPSGDRLRSWMNVSDAEFYDRRRIAIIPMGFCFPGLDAKGGDLPPRKECRETWHDQVFDAMPQIRLKLVIGAYAQAYHLGKLRRSSVRETVAAWREILETTRSDGVPALCLPHPSWRNNAWLKRNPWFEEDCLPVLREEVARLI